MTFTCSPNGLMGLAEEQRRLVFAANAARLNPHIHCSVVEFEPGWFAIYAPGVTFPMLVTQDWNALEAAYKSRPAYRPHSGAPSITPSKPTVAGLDVGKLNISI